MIKVVFFGTPNFSIPFLNELFIDERFSVVHVVSQIDKKSGRGQKLQSPPIIEFAKEKGINYSQPDKLVNNKDFRKKLMELDADFFIVVAYGKILRKNILDIPKKGCINVHPSLLPKYRGPSPIQEALKNGDDKTGICIMKLDEGMDSGPILKCEELSINDEDNYSHLENKILSLGPRLLNNTVFDFFNDKLGFTAQDDEKASYCHFIEKKDAELNFELQTAKHALNLIRAYSSWPQAEIKLVIDDKIVPVKIIEAEISDKDIQSGQIHINDQVIIGFKEGGLNIIKVKLPNKKPLFTSEVINSWKDKNISLFY